MQLAAEHRSKDTRGNIYTTKDHIAPAANIALQLGLHVSTTTAARDARVATPLRQNANFRLLMNGSFVSMLGSRVSSIAYPLLVLALTGSPIVAGWASFAALAPSVLVYLPAGALVDRWDPRRAMLWSELGRGAAIATIVTLLMLGRMSVVGLVAVAAIEQTLQVFSVLAERRFARSLMEPAQAASALAHGEARNHMVILVGRPLGGLLFGMGRIIPFMADAFSFFVTVGALILIGKRQGFTPQKISADRHLGHEIAAGFRWLHKHPFAGIALPLTAGTTLIGQALIMVFFAEAHARHLPSITIGIVLAASGAGGALGSAVASHMFRRLQHSLLEIQMLIWALMLVILVVWGGRSFLIMAAAMAVMGLTGALGNIEFDTFVVRKAETMLARVMSVDRLTSFGAVALGPPLGAILFAQFGTRMAIFGLLVITTVLLAVAAIALPPALRRDPLKPLAGAAPRTVGEDHDRARADRNAFTGAAGRPGPGS
jgi:MFS family permease